MPIFTVTIKGNGIEKTVEVNTETMVANIAANHVMESRETSVQNSSEPSIEPSSAPVTKPIVSEGNETSVVASAAASVVNTRPKSNGGKRFAPSFRLKKRRITRKLKKTR